MFNLIKKYAPNLQATLLLLMLALPFALYYFARSGSGAGVNLFLAIMGAVMLVAMKK